jgi:hypothetical protein
MTSSAARFYNNKIANDPEFYANEKQRVTSCMKNRYNSDEEHKEKKKGRLPQRLLGACRYRPKSPNKAFNACLETSILVLKQTVPSSSNDIIAFLISTLKILYSVR